ncbi:MAG: hypothetical protein Q7R88_00230, partial [bacterium]|nr:hypothetical protein [bacterium]
MKSICLFAVLLLQVCAASGSELFVRSETTSAVTSRGRERIIASYVFSATTASVFVGGPLVFDVYLSDGERKVEALPMTIKLRTHAGSKSDPAIQVNGSRFYLFIPEYFVIEAEQDFLVHILCDVNGDFKPGRSVVTSLDPYYGDFFDIAGATVKLTLQGDGVARTAVKKDTPRLESTLDKRGKKILLRGTSDPYDILDL